MSIVCSVWDYYVIMLPAWCDYHAISVLSFCVCMMWLVWYHCASSVLCLCCYHCAIVCVVLC